MSELKGFNFPGLDGTYYAVTPTELEETIDDLKENGTVANARQLIPSAMETERVPYNFRTSGGSLDIGDREFDKLVGLSLPWNQLWNINDGNPTSYNGVTYQSIGGRYKITGTANANGAIIPVYGYDVVIPANHVALYMHDGSGSFPWGRQGFSGTTTAKAFLSKHTATQSSNPRVPITSGVTYDIDTAFNIIDLTQLFGSTIADYIYSLEQATAGAGVAWFKKFFPKQYYSYNSGEIESVKVSSHDMVGFNQWDEEWENGDLDITTGQNHPNANRIRSKNYIHVLPNTKYYKIEPTNNGNMRICHYDANKNFLFTGGWASSGTFTTEPNEHYIRFFMAAEYGKTYKNDICFNIAWDDSRDGEYEPYKKNSYELDPIELRGILKLDSNNEPYADGDTYEADGTVTRRYGIVDLGTLNWSVLSDSPYGNFTTTALNQLAKQDPTKPTYICNAYDEVALNTASSTADKYIWLNNNKTLIVKDTSKASMTTEEFKTVMSGVYLVYELATPTTELADPFTDPQTVDNWGTEQYVDKAYTDGDRDVEIPCGHETKYPVNLRDKVETSPNAPTSDGDYIVHCESGQLTYIALGSTTTIQNIIARLEALEG